MWDARLSNSQWYVPAENLLAYTTSPTDLSITIPTADQTIWTIGTVVDGVFTGVSNAELKIGGTTSYSTLNMNGLVTDSGQIRILFSADGALTTIGIGQIREIESTTFFEMQMITGGDGDPFLTHWAYMAPYNGDPGTLPPLDISPDQLTSSEWLWMADTEWTFQNDDLFGVGGVGSFTVTDYVNGYYWGSGTGPTGSDAESFTLIGSATPEGNILFNLLSDNVLTSLSGMITGDAETGSMLLRTYDSQGTPGTLGEAHEPSTVALLLALGALLLFRRPSRLRTSL